MSTFKTSLFAIVMTIVTLIFASLTFAKQPPKSPLPPRPKPGHGPSLTNEQVANPQSLGSVTELGSSGGLTITHGGNPPRTPGSADFCHESCQHHCCDRDDRPRCEETFEPLHSACVVLPGDTLETVSLREYRTDLNARYIATFNRLPRNTLLVPGQYLMLPSIGANKVLSPSHAPIAISPQVAFEN